MTSIKIITDDDSDEELEYVKTLNKVCVQKKPTKIVQGNIINYIYPDSKKYNFRSWNICFPDKNVYLKSLLFNSKWCDFFDSISNKLYFRNIEQMLSECLKTKIILPHAELLFNIFNILSPKDIKCVIIGQDPYPGSISTNNIWIPYATGCSFSVPLGIDIPDSLMNIYKNLILFGHMEKYPDTGCLGSWIIQGCFMLNSTLTTVSSRKNVHQKEWKYFTDDLIKYLNSMCDGIVFLVWGKNAHITCKNVDPKKHFIITSSHPSPLGYHQELSGSEYGFFEDESKRPYVKYPSFSVTDHFGLANDYFIKSSKTPIIWDILNTKILK